MPAVDTETKTPAAAKPSPPPYGRQAGQITGTELRDAQINLTRARNEISVRRIRSKLAELGLLFEAWVLFE